LSKGNSKQGGISTHFGRAAKIIIGCFLLVLVLGISLAIFGPWLLRQIEIDKCLDGGGSYNHETNECNLETTGGDDGR
jgi:hypothetical protein